VFFSNLVIIGLVEYPIKKTPPKFPILQVKFTDIYCLFRYTQKRPRVQAMEKYGELLSLFDYFAFISKLWFEAQPKNHVHNIFSLIQFHVFMRLCAYFPPISRTFETIARRSNVYGLIRYHKLNCLRPLLHGSNHLYADPLSTRSMRTRSCTRSVELICHWCARLSTQLLSAVRALSSSIWSLLQIDIKTHLHSQISLQMLISYSWHRIAELIYSL